MIAPEGRAQVRELLVGLVIGVALGVGGVFGSMWITDDGESAECKQWNEAASRFLLADEPGDLDTYLTRTDKIMDIRYKACHM